MENTQLTDGLASIIAQLERQKSAIDRALEALRDVDFATEPTPAKRVAVKAPVKAAVDRRSEGQRKRWALKKTAEATSEATPETTPARKETSTRSRVTPEGRQKLADAMKKRWAAKRAGTKTARKKTT